MRPCPQKMHFGFGEKYPPALRNLTVDGKHHGQDFLTPTGTPIIACVNGVVYDRSFHRGYGLSFWIKFFVAGKTYRLILAHLSKITNQKKVGQKIGKTEVIGKSGDSGMATGHPHLHLEVQQLKNGAWAAIDPGFVTGC
ncbi:MAG: M23 family metallopeptidase [Candidatus Margulisiibacteriota bacterium]